MKRGEEFSGSLTPGCCRPGSPAAKVYGELARAVMQEVHNLKEKADTTPTISFDTTSKEFVINGSQRMSAVDLRWSEQATHI